MTTKEIGTARKPRAYAPETPLTIAPIWSMPPQPLRVLKWLFGFNGYLWPWHLAYGGLALLTYWYATPALSSMKTFEWHWVAFVFLRNLLITVAVVGAWHGWFYVKRAQSTEYKYNLRWPSADASQFLFRNQTFDNMFWTFASGVPIWTAYECVSYWLYANGHIFMVTFQEHPIWFVTLFVVMPLIAETHFYFIHRLLHWPPLYKYVHSLHHRNVNPGPWAGISMHPVEHLIYFSNVVLLWVIPSHPLHALLMLQLHGISPAQGHLGFGAMKLMAGAKIKLHDYNHYLHHKYFECNYGSPMLPLDLWFGTFHDGTPASDERMNRRMMSRMK